MSALGKKQTMCSAKGHVRFTPNSGHVRCKEGCPLSARSGHFAMGGAMSACTLERTLGHEKSVECCRHLTRGSAYRLYSHRPWSRRRQTVPHKTRPVIERLGNVTDHTCQAPSSLRRRAAVLRTCTAFVRVSFCNIGDGCQKMGSC
jgi:hypothetical protein